MAESYQDRPTRPCLACGQSDKAPKDVVAIADGSTVYFHMDCHALMGCLVCNEVVKVAGGPGPKGKKNENLLNAILENQEQEIFTTDDAAGLVAEGK